MNHLLLLVPFIVALLVTIVSKKAGYISLIISSGLLMIYAAFITGIGPLSFFYMISALVIIIVSWYSIGYDTDNKWFAPLFASAVLGIITILLSYNSLQFLVGWELMSISGYLMVGLNKKDHYPAFIFLAFSELSTVFLIAGMAYAFILTGTFNFVTIPSSIPLTLMAAGFLIKMGILPFMIADWLPIADSNAPSNGAAILSALMTLMGVFGLVKFTLLSPSNASLGVVLMGIGAFSVFFAALFEYVEENTKRFLGYSTIENNGVILVAVGLLMTDISVVVNIFIIYAILIMSLAHAISKSGLFLMTGSFDNENIDEINNSSNPMSAIGNIMISASLSGLLPTIGGVGIWMLLESLFMTATISTSWIAIPALIIGSLIALGEGIVSGAMIKFISFTQLFKAGKSNRPTNIYPILFAGILVILLGMGSTLIIAPTFVTGLIKLGIPNGLLLKSVINSSTTFGAIAPLFVALLISAFTLSALIIFGKPKIRKADVWNNGIEGMAGYTSFAFANNIRIMMGKILCTNQDTLVKTDDSHNIFWDVIVRSAEYYQKAAKYLTWNFMNSSMMAYVSYLIIAFIFTIVFVTLIY